MTEAAFSVGDRVVANHHWQREPGQIVDRVTLFDTDGKKPLFHIDFGRFELHLTAEEIGPVPGR